MEKACEAPELGDRDVGSSRVLPHRCLLFPGALELPRTWHASMLTGSASALKPPRDGAGSRAGAAGRSRHFPTRDARDMSMGTTRSQLRPLATGSVLALLLLPSLGTGSAAAQNMGGRDVVRIEEGETCPSGMTEIRPQMCMAPEFPPPLITDYHPKSMLVTKETPTPRAAFPVIDVHGHARGLAEPSTIEEMIGSLDELNVQLYIAADNVSGERLREAMAAIRASDHADRFRVMTGIDFRGVGTPGWAERAVRQLEEDVAAGAVGIGEVSKSFGMTVRQADGSRLRADDPELDA